LVVLRLHYPVQDFRVLIGPAVLLKNLVVSTMGFGEWVIAYWLAPLALSTVWVVQWRRGGRPLASVLSGRLVLLGCVVVGQAVIDVVTIASISVDAAEVNSELHTAVSRLLMQVLPLVFLGTLALWPDVLARSDAPPTHYAAEPDSAPAAELVAELPV
jgi:hypothetical protein